MKNMSRITTKLYNNSILCYKITEINCITIQGNRSQHTLLNSGIDLYQIHRPVSMDRG